MKRMRSGLVWKALAILGLLLLTMGGGLWMYASPSPHAYIETLFAGPIMLVGLVALGIGFIASGYRALQVLGGLIGAFGVLGLISFAMLILG